MIDIGKGQHESHRLALNFRDHVERLEDNRPKLLAHMLDFFFSERDKSPIVRPGVIQDGKDDCDVFIPILLIDLPHCDPLVPLTRLDDPFDQRREFFGDVEIVGVKRLRAGIA